MKQTIRAGAMSALLAAAFGFAAKADVVLSGPDANDGSYSTSALQTAAGANTTSADGLVGIPLWNFLGGADAVNPNAPVYGAITTSTPAGLNNKNAILRYYLVGTNATGQQSVVSLGEIDPRFCCTPSKPAFVAFASSGGGLLAEPQLVIPGVPGRGLSNLTSLTLLSVPAIGGAGGPTTSFDLSGNVTNPGTYDVARLQSNFTAVHPVIGGDTYTGVPLWNFLNVANGGSTNQIVITQASDGYEVVLSLAELDPSLGGNPDDLLPYADTTGTFSGPSSVAVARTILPTDNAHGRWQQNLTGISVVEAPEPASLTLFGVALAAFAATRRRKATPVSAPA